nr:hypothetical protein [Tanacetum cinerariifolium]
YLNDVDTIFNKSERNDEMIHPGGEISIFSSKGRPIEVAEIYQEEEPHLNMPVDSYLNQPSLTRGSVPLEVVDASTAYDDSTDDEFSDDDDIDSAKSLSSSHEESPLDDYSDSE